jgi:hypothetical protein
MPTRSTTRKAKRDLREGYAPTTAAGEFVQEEMHHRKEGRHGAESRRQAIAIGLSKARRAGVPLGEPPAGSRRPGTGRSGASRRAARSRGTAPTRRGGRKAARTRSHGPYAVTRSRSRTRADGTRPRRRATALRKASRVR